MNPRAAVAAAVVLAVIPVLGCRGAAEKAQKAVKEEKTLPAPGQPGKSITAEAVIDRIVEQAPTRLSALEKILGPERFTLSFTPSIDAAAVIEALGVKKPVVVSTDVHMTSRIVADYATKAFPETGGYRIELNVVKEGLSTTNLEWPASAVWKAEGCRIESIEATALDRPPDP